ncbi:MAG: asparagine synthase (glutamine-hydrolyzing), partial [Owenweeksia sp.]
MCGFAGFVDFNKQTSEEVLRAVTDSLIHRGPDSSGYYFSETNNYSVGLGHRRLSIIDLSEAGSQPMHFENLHIIFNGEAYNFAEVRAELEKEGYSFVSTSDTEVVLKAYHKWGAEAVHKFIGMFAFVIYDDQKEQLLFFRDRAGVKPFYYYQKDGIVLFASEIKAFHQHPRFQKKLDHDSLSWYFKGGYIPVPHTIYQNCHKLPQGHFARLNLKTREITEEKYWDVIDFFNKGTIDISENEAIEQTEKLLKSAFNYRMVADVPVGMFLSGGYDSTAVTALLQSDRTEKIKTFTIGFKEEGFDEAPEARKIAEHLGTDHHEYYCTAQDALDILPTLPGLYDEPFG